MRLSDLQAVSQLHHRYGLKAVVYGGPGTGKTPMLMTAPNAVHCFSEPGLLSVRTSQQAGYVADTYAKMLDYVQWACTSSEAKQFETKTFDSLSQMAELILAEESSNPKNPNPKSWYGEMSKKMMGLLNMIYFAPAMNAVMIAKEGIVEIPTVSGFDTKYAPYFPGKDLGIKVPHLFDSVWRIEFVKDAKGVEHRVMRTKGNYQAFARERSGNLLELEAVDLAYLIGKSMHQ